MPFAEDKAGAAPVQSEGIVLRFYSWAGLRKAVRSWACGSLAAELQSTREELAVAIAENARLAAERRDTELQIREKNLFLGSLSHELRAPLNAIIGFSEILASGGLAPDSSKREEFAKHVYVSGVHLLRLINDVLELSKVDAGGHEFFPEPVKLVELITRVADLLHTRLVRRRLGVAVDVEAEVAEVVADPAGLRQALLNHLSHAVEMASEGSGITVRALLQGTERFRIEIQIPQTMGFSRMHARESHSLDLTLARRLVEAQGGEAGQSVDPVLGTTLYLVLNRFQRAPIASGSVARHAVPVEKSTTG